MTTETQPEVLQAMDDTDLQSAAVCIGRGVIPTITVVRRLLITAQHQFDELRDEHQRVTELRLDLAAIRTEHEERLTRLVAEAREEAAQKERARCHAILTMALTEMEDVR